MRKSESAKHNETSDQNSMNNSATKMLESLVQASPLAIVVLDRQANVLMWSPAAEVLFGWTAGEVLGRPVPIIPEDLRTEFTTLFGDEIKGTTREGLELRRLRRDGSLLDVSLWTAPLKDSNEKIIGTVGFFADITERKRTEEALRESEEKMGGELRRIQKLESVGVLAGGIAHDFNNLLTAVLGSIDLSKMHVDKESRTYRRLEEAERATMRAAELTQQLLAFSRGGAPVKKSAAIAEIIRQSARFALSGSNVKCAYQFPDNLWSVEVDEDQMHQVFHNLIINAGQAMPEGGIISVHAENALLEAGGMLQPGKYVKIAIKDEGPGISEAHIQKIFDPYFTTKERCRGLGLAVAYSILKNHGGYITAESRAGAGATFTIYLPASEKPVAEEKILKGEPVVGKGRILVMDDEEAVRTIAGEILQEIGYEVEFARDGQEAIELHRRANESARPFDVVIMDLTVPGGMGGKEAIKRLRGISPHLKAIVSSGYAQDQVMASFRDYGFDAVIPKPYKSADLSRIVHEVLGHPDDSLSR